MRKYLAVISLLVFLALGVSMCTDSPTGSDDSEEDTTYELEVDISPDGAGTASPNSGTYDEGEEVSISADAEEGWEFENWTGENITSSDNPVEIEMNEDRNLTANFVEGESSAQESFNGVMTVTDGEQARNLAFSASDASGVREGLDDNDIEGPPIAPQGAFFTGFSHDGMNLYEDIRPVSDEIIWELRLQRAEGETMELEWELQESINGQLKLVDDLDASNPDVAVNMLEESTYDLADQSTQSLYIVYSAGEADKEKSPKDDYDSVGDEIKEAKQTIDRKKNRN